LAPAGLLLGTAFSSCSAFVEFPGGLVDADADRVHVQFPGGQVDVSDDGLRLDVPGLEVNVSGDLCGCG